MSDLAPAPIGPATGPPPRSAARLLRAAGLLLLLIVPGRAGTPDLGPVVDPPPMPMPAYLEAARDPAFGTPLRRVTEPGRPMAGGRCGQAYCTHRYSSAQAWNADQSLFVIANGCAGLCFLDGRTYRPLFHRATSDACEWHPTDPAAMICVTAGAVYLWAPQTNRVLSALHLRGFQRAEFGPYKGNPSASGERVVVRARDAAGRLVAFAVDLAAGRLLPPIALEALPGTNNACTIASSGRYIVCMQDLPEERETLYVFTAEGAPVQAWTEHHRPGHGDLTTDPDGEDVYVGISKSEPDRFHVIKRRLRDGLVTDLLPYGQISHASLRNTGRPGWVFLSFTGRREDVEGTPENGKAPFFQEVVALRIDGSGALRRLVQTRNAPADYWSETHASPSPDGTQMVFSSNWGRPGGPVSDYVATLAWPETGQAAGPRPPGPAPARDAAFR